MKHILIVCTLIAGLSDLYSQEFAVTPTKLNVLYYGIRNPVKTVVEDQDCDSILIFAEGCRIEGSSCNYYIIPDKMDFVSIIVGTIHNNDTLLVGKTDFRVKYVPDPVAMIASRSEGNMVKNVLQASPGIRAELNFDYEVVFKVESYSVIIQRDKEIIFQKEYSGNRFTDDFKEQIGHTHPGDKVRFEKIVAKGEDGTTRFLIPVTFKIR